MTDRTHPDSGRATGGIVQALQARIADLEAQLASIGAGGVSGPLIGQPQAMPDLSQLTERGAVAWAGVDAQGLREGGADMSKEREAFERALTELAARYDEAIRPSDFSRDDTGAYHNDLTEISWMLWQAHTSLSANAGFTAADMATASAQGFRDGVAAPQPAVAAGWQSIETAPKDSGYLLLRGRRKQDVASGYWLQAAYAGNGAWIWPFVHMTPRFWAHLPPTSAEGVEHG